MNNSEEEKTHSRQLTDSLPAKLRSLVGNDRRDKSTETKLRLAEKLARQATGTFKPKFLTKTGGILSTYLFDDPLLAYLEPGEYPEYFFKHNKNGFQITDPDGTEHTPHHQFSGRKYVLVTNRRILYVAGHTEGDTVIQFPYDDIANAWTVERTTTGNRLVFESDGKEYRFQTVTNTADVPQASKYIQKRVERGSAGNETTVDENTVKSLRSTLAWARRAAEQGNYGRAIELADEILDRLSAATAAGGATTTVDELRTSVLGCYSSWMQAYAGACLDTGARTASEENYAEAAVQAAEAVEHLQGAVDRIPADTSTPSLEQLQETAWLQYCEWLERSIRAELNAGETAAEQSNYQIAVDRAAECLERLQTALTLAEYTSLDADRLTELHETASERGSTWESRLLVGRIEAARESDSRHHERATDQLNAALSRLRQPDVLSERERSFLIEEVRTAYVEILNDAVQGYLRAGCDRMEASEYETACEEFDKATNLAAEAWETTADWDVDTTPLERSRQEVHNEYATAQTALVEKRLKDGINAFGDGQYERAQNLFTTASEAAAEARETADRTDLDNRLSDLREVAESNADIAHRAALGIRQELPELRRPGEKPTEMVPGQSTAGTNENVHNQSGETDAGPPSEIPGAPNISIAYDDIEKHDILGMGGHGEVYTATATADGTVHELAVKEPRFQGTISTRVVEEFVQEAETWAKLDGHDHVVGVVDWGVEPLPWIAMEHMDGGDLGERLDRMTLPEAAWTALVVTEAVLYAHRHGIMHLDLKPENILFRDAPPDAWGIPKVADWGLARLLLEHPDTAGGKTPRYAAPEQFEDAGSVGQATDTYQLGTVLYELFTGRPPFVGSTGETVEQIRAESVALPTEIDPSLPNVVDDVLQPALQKEPGDRYEDLLYLRDRLRELHELVAATER